MPFRSALAPLFWENVVSCHADREACSTFPLRLHRHYSVACGASLKISLGVTKRPWLQFPRNSFQPLFCQTVKKLCNRPPRPPLSSAAPPLPGDTCGPGVQLCRWSVAESPGHPAASPFSGVRFAHTLSPLWASFPNVFSLDGVRFIPLPL